MSTKTRPNPYLCLLTGLAITLLLAGLSAIPAGQQIALAEAPNGLAAVTRTPTPTRPPRLTPTRTLVTSSLKKQLFWGGLGGEGDTMDCTPNMLDDLRQFPDLVATGRLTRGFRLFPHPLDNVGLCIFGLPFDQGFSIEVYRPEGRLAGMSEFYLDKKDSETEVWYLPPVDPSRSAGDSMGLYFDQTPVIYLKLWMPAGLPGGNWYARVNTPYGSTAGSFYVPNWQPAPMVSIGRPPAFRFSDANPLGPERWSYQIATEDYLGSLTTGDTIRLYGAGFQPGSAIPLGVYQTAPDARSYLTNQFQAVANSRGEWSAVYTLGISDPPGAYDLLVLLAPGKETGNASGPAAYYQIEQWRPCPNSYTSILKAGLQAKVNEQYPQNQRVRRAASRSAAVIGAIPPGEQFQILDGPACADGWVWWRVKSQTGLEGWTSEGDGTERWLVPVE